LFQIVGEYLKGKARENQADKSVDIISRSFIKEREDLGTFSGKRRKGRPCHGCLVLAEGGGKLRDRPDLPDKGIERR